MGDAFRFIWLFGIAVAFTSLVYALAFFTVSRRLMIVVSAAIGVLVVSLGYLLHRLDAPTWLIMAGPVPFGLAGCLIALRDVRRALMAYGLAWVFYVGAHLLLSGVFGYDFLIPAWHVHLH